jgi:hypothetical protein
LVDHIVLIRWTEQASQEAIASAVAELRGMKSKIEGIVDLSCGANFSDRAKGYAQGMVVRFLDRAALAAFYPLCRTLLIRLALTFWSSITSSEARQGTRGS